MDGRAEALAGWCEVHSVLTHFSVAKGNERRFEEEFATLQAEIISGEAGTVGFQLYRSSDTARDYLLIAHFRDEAAQEAHESGIIRKRAKALYALCEGSPKIGGWRAL